MADGGRRTADGRRQTAKRQDAKVPGRQALGVPDQPTGASETSTRDEELQPRAQFHEQHVGGSGRETPSRVPTA